MHCDAGRLGCHPTRRRRAAATSPMSALRCRGSALSPSSVLEPLQADAGHRRAWPTIHELVAVQARAGHRGEVQTQHSRRHRRGQSCGYDAKLVGIRRRSAARTAARQRRVLPLPCGLGRARIMQWSLKCFFAFLAEHIEALVRHSRPGVICLCAEQNVIFGRLCGVQVPFLAQERVGAKPADAGADGRQVRHYNYDVSY